MSRIIETAFGPITPANIFQPGSNNGKYSWAWKHGVPIYTFSTLPGCNGGTCPVTCPGCYAARNVRLYPSCRMCWSRNTELQAMLCSGVRDTVNAAGPVLYDAVERLPKNAIVRLYAAGDLGTSGDNARAMLSIWWGMATIRPDVTFFGYTKSLPAYQMYQRSFSDQSNLIYHLSYLRDEEGRLVENFAPRPRIDALVKANDGHLCGCELSKSVKCLKTCRWCIRHENAGKALGFVQHG